MRTQRRQARAARFAALFALAFALSGCGLMSWDDKPAPRSSHGKTATRSKPVTPPPGGEYIVKAGDTLYSIAFRNQLDYHDLANWNDIGRDYAIHVGQKLRLSPPGSETAVVAQRNSPQGDKPLPDLPPAKPDDVAPIGDWRWPTSGELLRRYDPDNGQKGLDIGGQPGQPVYAAAAGKVVYSGSALKGYGELVIIKHNDRYLSAYGYNRRRLVDEGQQVSAGQPIAELGEGPSQQPLLHFEIRDKGTPVDPLRFLPSR